MEEMRQVLVVNNLKIHTHRIGELSFEAASWGGSKGKRAMLHYDEVESHGVRRTVALGKRRDPLSRVDSDVDLRHALNAKQGREKGD